MRLIAAIRIAYTRWQLKDPRRAQPGRDVSYLVLHCREFYEVWREMQKVTPWMREPDGSLYGMQLHESGSPQLVADALAFRGHRVATFTAEEGFQVIEPFFAGTWRPVWLVQSPRRCGKTYQMIKKHGIYWYDAMNQHVNVFNFLYDFEAWYAYTRCQHAHGMLPSECFEQAVMRTRQEFIELADGLLFFHADLRLTEQMRHIDLERKLMRQHGLTRKDLLPA